MTEEEINNPPAGGPKATLTSVSENSSSPASKRGEPDERKYATRAPRRPRFNDRHRQKPVVRQIKVLRHDNEGSAEDHARVGQNTGLRIVHFWRVG